MPTSTTQSPQSTETEVEISYYGTRGQCAIIEGNVRRAARIAECRVVEKIQIKRGWVQQSYTLFVQGERKRLAAFSKWWNNYCREMAAENPWAE